MNSSALLAGLSFLLSITAYAPDSGDGISGSGTMASGKLPYLGAAACPKRMPFGTILKLTGRAAIRARALRLPTTYTCEDRFANADREGVDIAIPKGYAGLSDQERIELALLFGLVKSTVVKEKPYDAEEPGTGTEIHFRQ